MKTERNKYENLYNLYRLSNMKKYSWTIGLTIFASGVLLFTSNNVNAEELITNSTDTSIVEINTSDTASLISSTDNYLDNSINEIKNDDSQNSVVIYEDSDLTTSQLMTDPSISDNSETSNNELDTSLVGTNLINTDDTSINTNDSMSCEVETNVESAINNINSKATVETDGKDFTNTNYSKNPNNPAHDHTKVEYTDKYGPIDLEFNYWKGNNSESFRVNLGTDLKFDNGQLTVTLPYDNLQDLINDKQITFINSSEWLVKRLYDNKSKYDKYVTENDKLINDVDVNNLANNIPEYIVDGNKIIFNLNSVDARSTMALEIKRVYNTTNIEDYTLLNTNKSADVELDADLNFDYIELPGNEKVFKLITSQENVDKLIEELSNNIQKENNGTKNGYKYETIIDKQIIKQEGNCVEAIITVKTLNKFEFNAESIMDTTLPDYSNSGYTEKILNPKNHVVDLEANPGYENLFGPGNLEVQHWQSGPNELTKTQNWRYVFATDYAIKNGKIEITLPYDAEDVILSDATSWVVDKYYPTVTGNKYYSNMYSISSNENYISIIKREGNTLTLDIGNVDARTALGIVVTKKFDTPKDFSSNPLSSKIKVSGEWNFDNIELNNTIETKTVICSDCKDKLYPNPPTENGDPEIPITPSEPGEPMVPFTPNEPIIPNIPDSPEITIPTDNTPNFNNSEDIKVISNISNDLVDTRYEQVANHTPTNTTHNPGIILPKTSTNLANMTLLGFISLLIGSLPYFKKKNR